MTEYWVLGIVDAGVDVAEVLAAPVTVRDDSRPLFEAPWLDAIVVHGEVVS